MATKNIKVLVRRPGHDTHTKLTFESITANDVIRVPRRTPYADIVNLDDLKASGFIRTSTTQVTTKYGGSNTAGAYSKLGLTLPRTEKLVLLVKNPATTAVSIKLSGNSRAGMGETTIAIPTGVAGDVYEIDLFDMGLHFNADEEGSLTLTPNAAVGMVLIARF